MPLNLEKYRPYLDDFDMTTAQKDEFIQSLWVIMQSFADQAFDPTSYPQDYEYHSSKNCSPESGVLQSGHHPDISGKAANDNRKG